MAWNDGLEEGTPAHTLASTEANTIRAVAGPGSGKSFAIKRRVARLLESGVAPDQILAITFTRTAAQDLKREISSLGIAGAEQVHSRTLHSHALRILMNGDVLAMTGRNPRMVIPHEIEPALRDIDREEYGGLRDKKALLDAYLAAWARLQADDAGFAQDGKQAAFEGELTGWLTEHEGILVGEVIPVAIRFLRNNPASPERNRYQVILVDEYQDLNKSEQEFIRLIRGNASIVIVGDDDQSIYGFKFAHPEGIREVQALHGAYHDVPFNECRRCPRQVTTMASELISRNPHRTLGALVPHGNNHNGIVQVIQWPMYDDEIVGLSQIILNELAAGIVRPEDILVLAPRRRIGYRLRDRLLAAGVPVKSYFREESIDSDAVRRAYSLLNFLANPSDTISLRYLLGFGSQDFRKRQYAILKQVAHDKGVTIHAVLQEILNGATPAKGLTTIVEEFRKIAADIAALKQAIIDDPENAFRTRFIRNDNDEIEFYELNQIYAKTVAEVGVDDIKANPALFDEWYKDVFTGIQETIALPEPPSDIDHIRIMSLHASKGLSAKVVVLSSMIDRLIPFLPRELTPEEIQAKIQEARRLFYVAVTRCKASGDYPGRLIISSFMSIAGVEALRMGISANPVGNLPVTSTRFLNDFGQTAPASILGQTLL